MAPTKSSGTSPNAADTTADGDMPAGGGHAAMARAIRALAMDGVEAAKSGHPGMPMGAADMATVLFARHMKFDATEPHWPDRDRFVLSAGHGSMLLYACLHLLGYEDLPIDELKRFRQLGSTTPGHPEFGHTAG
ncbi:Transketolase, partial [hydrothermal vent metagenome]